MLNNSEVRYYAGDPALGVPKSGLGYLTGIANPIGGQKSAIRFLELTFSNVVFLDPAANFGINLQKTSAAPNSPYLGPITVHVAATSHDPVTGAYTVRLGFGPTPQSLHDNGVQYRSLMDGRYNLTLDGNYIRDIDQNGSPASGLPSPVDFWRFFGDVSSLINNVATYDAADGKVDQTDFGFLTAAYRSRSAEVNYRAAFDFDGDGDIDTADYNQVRLRLNTQLP